MALYNVIMGCLYICYDKIDCVYQDNKIRYNPLYTMNMVINCADPNTTEEYVRDVISDKLKWGEIDKVVMAVRINGNGYEYKTVCIYMKTWDSAPDAEHIHKIIESDGKVVVQLSENDMDCWVITLKHD